MLQKNNYNGKLIHKLKTLKFLDKNKNLNLTL